MTTSRISPSLTRKVIVIGGGFSGACMAVQLVRNTKAPLAVTIVESNPKLGRGLAYSATDPDHRLNAPTYVHSMLPDDAWHFTRWCLNNNILDGDPQAKWSDGGMYIRRSDFGRYVEDTVRAHQHWKATGSIIVHVQEKAIGLRQQGGLSYVSTAQGKELEADMVIVATGNPIPRLQAPFAPALASHPSVVENPLDSQRLSGIDPQARVLLVGSGLTALDVLCTLVRQDHQGPIVVSSRRGQRPKPQGPVPAPLALASSPAALAQLPGGIVLDRIKGPAPAYFAAEGLPLTLRGMTRALRTRIREVQAAGATWYQAFDDLRDAVWQLWPRLPVKEQRRFLSKMRTWYDVHRFRSPPQSEQMVRAAEARGRIRFGAARLQSISAAEGMALHVEMRGHGKTESHRETFDLVINCTGLDALKGMQANPFLVAASEAGLIRRDSCSMGFEVDAQCRAVNAQGQAQETLRVVGPPTAGTFGDPIGAMFIGAQIHRVLPDVLRTLKADGNCGVTPAEGYAGDITPETAWEWMQSDQGLMVDVRSEAERTWVGLVPGSIALPWMHWPAGTLNPDFDAGLKTLQSGNRKLLMLCRSGVRSVAAAKRATELGFDAYNILEGFEGAVDSDEHRGTTGGWRFRQLPWKQS